MCVCFVKVCPGGGRGGGLAGRLCNDALTKNDEKGYFSSWAMRSAVIILGR